MIISEILIQIRVIDIKIIKMRFGSPVSLNLGSVSFQFFLEM